MRTLLIILTFLFTSHYTYACLSATQNRLFPIGLCSKGLIVMETHLERTSYFDKKKKVELMEPGWLGKSFLKIYDTNHKVVRSELLDNIKLFEQKDYDRIIGLSFNKGLLLAKQISDFVIAKPTSISFCDYEPTCSKAALVFDTVQNQIFLKLPDKIKFPINVLSDTASIASNVLAWFLSFDDGGISARELKDNIFINSVRQFQIGDKKLTVVHIGCGEAFELSTDPNYKPGEENKPHFAFTDIKKSIYNEPLLHHGQGFDFYIIE